MQGCKDSQQTLFQCVTLSALVPDDHFVRKLSQVVDLGWVRPATARYYSCTGRPSIDPVVIAKMLLLSFFAGIDSERELMRQIQVNVAYRWYLGYNLDQRIPNHSVLSKARRRFGSEFFQRMFAEVLASCRTAGLVDGQTILIDSTLIHANASTDSVKAYWRKLEASSDVQDSRPSLGRKKSRQNSISNTRRSTTDPDATFIRKPGCKGIGYKANVSADGPSGIITAATVSTAGVDDTAAVPELIEANPDVATVVADGQYGSHECLEYLQKRGLETIIKHRGGGNRHGRLAKNQFAYDKAGDCFTCPAGNKLLRRRTWRTAKKVVYSCQTGLCDQCRLRQDCIGQRPAGSVRQVTRYDTPYVERAEQAVKSSRGKRLLRLRHTCIEGLFGQAKQWHGMGRARWRGLRQVKIQVLVTAAVLNIKKLIKALFHKPTAESARQVLSNTLSIIVTVLLSFLQKIAVSTLFEQAENTIVR